MIPNDGTVLSLVGGLRLDFVVVGDSGVVEEDSGRSLPPPRWRMRTFAVGPVQVEAQGEVADGLDENCCRKDAAVDSANSRNNDRTTDFLTKRCEE
mmetsp:Transcript_11379/g.27107  ORF Transcript_11379/g.27107 Transcript_11379/m.27107 type:complete len:96 (-) Transcript_11379:347-634(-)